MWRLKQSSHPTSFVTTLCSSWLLRISIPCLVGQKRRPLKRSWFLDYMRQQAIVHVPQFLFPGFMWNDTKWNKNTHSSAQFSIKHHRAVYYPSCLFILLLKALLHSVHSTTLLMRGPNDCIDAMQAEQNVTSALEKRQLNKWWSNELQLIAVSLNCILHHNNVQLILTFDRTSYLLI